MRNVLIFVLALFLGSASLVAQTDRATLSGTVTDRKQSLIPRAKVIVKSIATGLEYNATTNSAGIYIVPSLPVGQYTASISADGFQKIEFKPFTLGHDRDAVIAQIAGEQDVIAGASTGGGQIQAFGNQTDTRRVDEDAVAFAVLNHLGVASDDFDSGGFGGAPH